MTRNRARQERRYTIDVNYGQWRLLRAIVRTTRRQGGGGIDPREPTMCKQLARLAGRIESAVVSKPTKKPSPPRTGAESSPDTKNQEPSN